MDHQSFRFYIPGVVFLFPIFLVACWITITRYDNPDIRAFVLVGGISVFPAIALPIGWWIFNAYRVWWLFFTNGGYAQKDFLKIICKNLKPFYSPLTDSILIDLSHMKGIEKWIAMEPEIFRKTFCPSFSRKRFLDEIQSDGIYPRFTEHLGDFLLFRDSSFDYARSISSVRYGLESSVFALVLGVFYAFGLKNIWSSYLESQENRYAFEIWILLVGLVSLTLIITLIIRWRDAANEYDARLILTTIVSLESNHLTPEFFAAAIPETIAFSIKQLCPSNGDFAAFDLDNTLLIDDIGEAVFSALLKDGLVDDFSWNEYSLLLENDRASAYRKVIQVMEGLSVDQLKEVTNRILDSEQASIEVQDGIIPIPKANRVMQNLISLLKTKNIDVYVVTATNQISAEIFCWKYFGIPASHVIGAQMEISRSNHILSDSAELPFEKGKVDALKKRFKQKPLVTGGDGLWDKFLLDYTDPKGVRLWLGQNTSEYEGLKADHFKDVDFLHVTRD